VIISTYYFYTNSVYSAIENFKALADAGWDRTSKAFDLIVGEGFTTCFCNDRGLSLGQTRELVVYWRSS
jgi:hypothetical protein